MRLLFERPDGSPMQFHLAELTESDFQKYKKLISLNGGNVEECAKSNVLTFIPSAFSKKYSYVFDVKFIDDCIKFETILNVDSYFIGDSRFNRGCPLSKSFMQTNSCLLNQLQVFSDNDVSVKTYKQIFKKTQLKEKFEKNVSHADASTSTSEISDDTVNFNGNNVNNNVKAPEIENKTTRNDLITTQKKNKMVSEKKDELNKTRLKTAAFLNLKTTQIEQQTKRNNNDDEMTQEKNKKAGRKTENLNKTYDKINISDSSDNDLSENFEMTQGKDKINVRKSKSNKNVLRRRINYSDSSSDEISKSDTENTKNKETFDDNSDSNQKEGKKMKINQEKLKSQETSQKNKTTNLVTNQYRDVEFISDESSSEKNQEQERNNELVKNLEKTQEKNKISEKKSKLQKRIILDLTSDEKSNESDIENAKNKETFDNSNSNQEKNKKMKINQEKFKSLETSQKNKIMEKNKTIDLVTNQVEDEEIILVASSSKKNHEQNRDNELVKNKNLKIRQKEKETINDVENDSSENANKKGSIKRKMNQIDETTRNNNDDLNDNSETRKKKSKIVEKKKEMPNGARKTNETGNEAMQNNRNNVENVEIISGSTSNEDNEQLGKYIKRLTQTKLNEMFNTPELQNWLSVVNNGRPKDKEGYPRKYFKHYDRWELLNLIDLIIKTNSYDYINSELFWKHVAKLKVVAQSRDYRSLHNHMSKIFLNNIENCNYHNLTPEVKQKFIDIRELIKRKREARLGRKLK